MSKYARKKGHDFERQCAAKLRHIDFKDCKTARAGDRSRDDKGIDLLGTEPFAIQCKNMQRYASGNVLDEIKCDSTEIPVVFSKAVRKKDIAILYKDDFIDLVEMLKFNGIL